MIPCFSYKERGRGSYSELEGVLLSPVSRKGRGVKLYFDALGGLVCE